MGAETEWQHTSGTGVSDSCSTLLVYKWGFSGLPALRQTCLLLLEYNGRGWITQLLLPALFPRPLTILFLRSTYIWNRERVFQEPERGLRRALSEPQSTLQPWLHSGDHTQKSYGRWTQSYRMKLNGPIGKVLFVAWKRQLPENLII